MECSGQPIFTFAESGISTATKKATGTGTSELARRLELLLHLIGDESACVAPWQAGRPFPSKATLLVVPDDLSRTDAKALPADTSRITVTQATCLVGIQLARPRDSELSAGSARALLGRLGALEEYALKIGHDFSGPMLAISAAASAARHHIKKSQDSEADELLARIETVAEGVRSRMRGLLESMRTGQALVPTTRHDLLSLARVGVDRAARLAPNLRVSMPRRKEPIWVAANKDLAVETLTNLYANAGIHGRDAAGVARVATRVIVRGQTATLVIADRGPGVAQDRLGEMLSPFVRGNDDDSGSGVGLPLALHAMRSQGGRLRLESPASSDPDQPGLRASAEFRLWKRKSRRPADLH